MKSFKFDGIYETNVELPDGAVVTVQPGDIMSLPYDTPGPLWSLSKGKATVDTPDHIPSAYTPGETGDQEAAQASTPVSTGAPASDNTTPQEA
jgi:hypothetical protein